MATTLDVKDDTDAIVAMTVSQAVLAPTLLERSEDEVEPPSRPVQRVDFPPTEDDTEETEEMEGTRGPATMWLKENQLMLTQVQPRDTTTGKLKTSGKAYGGVWASLVRMYKEEGYAGFMRGNGINCARIIPYSAVQFTTYEALKTWLKTYSGEENLSTPWRLTAGACAGIASVVSTYPLDLVRSRISIATASIAPGRSPQMARTGMRSGAKVFEQRDLGIWGMSRHVYRTEGGVKGL
ncbi:hypothetical protein QFC20_001258 [Naganishia adeliensis]|uniref:Uncharacterized protein n=1 Tax=Naganishia adeliensis TaxID=92952 RepID=A0ACC2WUU4_9TREE|nr:hypothetical protein QFC20_001258 [Naganishia adeliensis]